MGLTLFSFLVHDYDEAIAFFVGALGFTLSDDSPSLAGDGTAKRWVVVSPPDGTASLLLAEARGDDQRRAVGHQFADRVGLFLRVADFTATYERMVSYGVTFLGEPRQEAYGTVVVFADLYGNKWDLLGPTSVEPAALDVIRYWTSFWKRPSR